MYCIACFQISVIFHMFCCTCISIKLTQNNLFCAYMLLTGGGGVCLRFEVLFLSGKYGNRRKMITVASCTVLPVCVNHHVH
jgi:hypothetical protein